MPFQVLRSDAPPTIRLIGEVEADVSNLSPGDLVRRTLELVPVGKLDNVEVLDEPRVHHP